MPSYLNEPGSLVNSRALLAAVALGLGCRDSGGPDTTPACDPGSTRITADCVPYARVSVERITTPWTELGQAVTLQLVVYQPLGSGPYPTVIFHHGSTGSGDNPALFTQTWTSDALARVLVGQGWQVLFPQRRGRGSSGGLYDEGFEPDRSRYSCRQQFAAAGLTHALDDAEVILDAVRTRTDVDASRLVVGGFSRGGILAMAHASQHSATYLGVINVVGGWIGEGCIDAVAVNRAAFVSAAASTRPSLWLYGENDPFYSIAHSRANFDAFQAAGGNGVFKTYRRSSPAASGHQLLNEPALWQGELRGWLSDLSR